MKINSESIALFKLFLQADGSLLLLKRRSILVREWFLVMLKPLVVLVVQEPAAFVSPQGDASLRFGIRLSRFLPVVLLDFAR